MRWKSWIRSYQTLAVIILNLALLFLFLNGVAQQGLIWFERHPLPNAPIVTKYEDTNAKFRLVYPHLSPSEVEEILFETWNRPLIYEPFTQFKERPYQGKHIRVSEAGFRFVKDQAPWPPNSQNFNLFLFGGSTLFNYGVTESETLASQLQTLLNAQAPDRPVTLYNFGRGFYYSSQERILFEQLLRQNFVPDLAIFLDGLNEFWHSQDAPAYTHVLQKAMEPPRPTQRHLEREILKALPLTRFIAVAQTRWNPPPLAPSLPPVVDESRYQNMEILQSVIQRYLSNKRLIEGVASAFGVQVLFVWQPVPTYHYDLQNHLFLPKDFELHTYSKYGYPQIATLWKEKKITEPFLWLADLQQDRNEPLYIDAVHYSPRMSRLLAEALSQAIQERRLLLTHSKL